MKKREYRIVEDNSRQDWRFRIQVKRRWWPWWIEIDFWDGLAVAQSKVAARIADDNAQVNQPLIIHPLVPNTVSSPPVPMPAPQPEGEWYPND